MQAMIFGQPVNSFELLSEETLAAPAGSFTAVTIPTCKQILVIIEGSVSAGGDAVGVRLNADAGANYRYNYVRNVVNVVSGNRAAGSAFAYGHLPSGTDALTITWLFDNSNTTKNRTYQARGCDYDAQYIMAGRWDSTNAITSVQGINGGVITFAAGSRCSVFIRR